MALTPLRIALLLLSTLVLSTAGLFFLFMGVHGPQIMTIVAVVLLLPNVILLKLGVPVAIPFINSGKILPILFFLVLQAAYYYGLVRLIYFVRARRKLLA
jgi:hypothetical protein